MKKLIVIAVIAMMIASLSVAANAVQGDFALLVRGVLVGGGATPTVQVGTCSYASDGDPDGWFNNQYLAPGAGTLCLDVTGLGVTDPNYNVNIGANLTSASDVKVWNLKAYMVYDNSTAANQTFSLAGGFMFDGPLLTAGTGAITDPNFFVKIYDGQNVTTGTPLLTFTQATGYAKDNQGVIVKDFGNGAGALSTGTFTMAKTGSHYFTVVAGTEAQQVITPEPGSIVALFSGLVGLVGFGIRRRK